MSNKYNIPAVSYNDDHKDTEISLAERMFSARINTCKMEELALKELMDISQKNTSR